MLKKYGADAITADEAVALQPSHLVISPGPGRPEAAGATPEILRQLCERVPTLGVCLGHQALVQVYGGEVARARELVAEAGKRNGGERVDLLAEALRVWPTLEGPDDEFRAAFIAEPTLDVAVVDVKKAGRSEVRGFVPVGWYPSALAISEEGGALYVLLPSSAFVPSRVALFRDFLVDRVGRALKASQEGCSEALHGRARLRAKAAKGRAEAPRPAP